MNRKLIPARAALLAAFALIPAALVLGACEDPFSGLGDPVLVTDSIVIASPTGTSQGPTALDITSGNRLRRPELPGEAGAWDFQLRQQGNVFSLLPIPQNGTFRGSGIRAANRDFDQAEEAPRDRAGYTRTLFPIAVGQTYYIQSRESQAVFCAKYGVLKVLSADPAAGTVRVVVRSNQQCDDERLVP